MAVGPLGEGGLVDFPTGVAVSVGGGGREGGEALCAEAGAEEGEHVGLCSAGLLCGSEAE